MPKTEIACGRVFEVAEPGDRPAVTDKYLLTYWEGGGVQALVDLLHAKDRELASWQTIHDQAVELAEKRNLEYWALKKEHERLKARLARIPQFSREGDNGHDH